VRLYIGLYVLGCCPAVWRCGSTNKYTKFGQLIIRKIIKIIATRCHILRHRRTKFDSRRLSVRASFRLCLRWSLTRRERPESLVQLHLCKVLVQRLKSYFISEYVIVTCNFTFFFCGLRNFAFSTIMHYFVRCCLHVISCAKPTIAPQT